MSVSRDELEKRLVDYGCKFRADIGGGRDLWIAGWGEAFVLKRWRDTENYHESDCLDVMLFLLKEMPFEWSVKKEFTKVWGAISGLEGQVGRLRGQLRRQE